MFLNDKHRAFSYLLPLISYLLPLISYLLSLISYLLPLYLLANK